MPKYSRQDDWFSSKHSLVGASCLLNSQPFIPFGFQDELQAFKGLQLRADGAIEEVIVGKDDDGFVVLRRGSVMATLVVQMLLGSVVDCATSQKVYPNNLERVRVAHGAGR